MKFIDFFRNKNNLSDGSPENRHETSPIGYRTGTLQGLGTREMQEDCFGLINDSDVTAIKSKGMLALVADGMGGMNGGKDASETALKILSEWFKNFDRNGDICADLEKSVKLADEAVYQKYNGLGGTTLIACVVFNGQLYFASVGDSYLYLKRGARLYRMNLEHNYKMYLYNKLINEKNLDKETVEADPNISKLTSYVGIGDLKEIDMLRSPMTLMPEDEILIASDGVGGVLDEDIIIDCLEGTTPQEACYRINQYISGRKLPHQDNYTAVIIKCE